MELCDYYLKYMNALCEGTLAAPEGIALSGETPEERAMSLQAALKNVSVPDFVRRCARAAGDALPDGLLDGFHEEDFARALFARMALGGAPQPEEPQLRGSLALVPMVLASMKLSTVSISSFTPMALQYSLHSSHRSKSLSLPLSTTVKVKPSS